MASKRVLLQVLPSLYSGGVERGTIDIASAAYEAGYRSLVASNGGKLVAQLTEKNAEHLHLPCRTKNPLKILQNSWKLRHIADNYSVNIMHARSRAPAWSAYYATRVHPSCRFVTSFHGFYSGSTNPLKRLYNSVMAKGDVVIAVSRAIYKHVQEIYGVEEERLRLIHRGVDEHYFTPDAISPERCDILARRWALPAATPLLLMPARLTAWKGHDIVIEALKNIRECSFHCVFLGDKKSHPDYVNRLQKHISNAGLENRITIEDAIDDMPAAYSLADIVLAPSTRPEAFGRIAMEAQAMRTLIIGTNHGGTQETIKHNVTGWLVEPKNTADLAKALVEALTLPKESRDAMGHIARRYVIDNFSLEKMTRKTLEIYDSFF